VSGILTIRHDSTSVLAARQKVRLMNNGASFSVRHNMKRFAKITTSDCILWRWTSVSVEPAGQSVRAPQKRYVWGASLYTGVGAPSPRHYRTSRKSVSGSRHLGVCQFHVCLFVRRCLLLTGAYVRLPAVTGQACPSPQHSCTVTSRRRFLHDRQPPPPSLR
jgi:hypothetical protein